MIQKKTTRSKKINLLTLLLCGVQLLTQAQTNYYLSPNGNDANNGTSTATPWKTLTKINSQSIAAGSTISFEKGGVFNGALTISNKIGTAANPIIYTSYGSGNKPIIRASVRNTSWTVVSGNVWKTSLGLVGGKRLASLYINAIPQQIGREPNANTTNNGFRIIKSHTADNLSISESSNLPYATNFFQGGEITIRTLNDLMKSELVSSHTASTVVFTQASPTSASENIIRDNYGYFFQNHVNTLDQEGEWAHDTANSLLYLYSTVDPNSIAVEIPSESNAVDIKNNSKFIEIRELQFENGIKNVMNLSSVSNITIDNCVFNNGNEYVSLGFTLTDLTFTNNTINDSNSVGFRWEGCSGLTFSNNTITNIGMRAGMGAISFIPYTGLRIITNGAGNPNMVEKNKLDGIGYHGINFAGGNITVRYNEVANYCATKDDGGGIYTVNNQNANNSIYKNIVHDAPGASKGNPIGASPKTAGIYLDNNSNNQIVSQNTVYNVGAWGIMTNLSGSNTVTDNTVYNCGTAIVSSTYANTFGAGGATAIANNNTYMRNILFPKLSTQYCATYNNSITAANFGTYLGTLDTNYYCQPVTGGKVIATKEGSTSKEYTLASFKTTFPNYELNSIVAPVQFSNTTDPNTIIRFEVNNTDVPKTVNLGSTVYKDAKNASFSSNITIQPYASLALLNTGQTLSINDFEESKLSRKFFIYPNPTTDYITIDSLSVGDALKIFDLNGKLILSNLASKSIETLNLSTIPSGVYIITIGNTFKYKIVKQ